MYTIPIMVDNVRKDFPFGRFTYFSIECDVPSPGWSLILNQNRIPFYLIGISGIIWKPIGENATFDSPDLIDELFDLIEDHPSLFVDINDIWLPNILFSSSLPKRGQVYRIDEELFASAYRFRKNEIEEKEFIAASKELKNLIFLSRKEGFAFKAWEQNQIKLAKEAHKKNDKLALKWKE